MVLKKSLSLGLQWLRSVVSCCRQTCPFDLFEPSSLLCLGQTCQFDIFGSSSEMPLSDDLVTASLADARSDTRYLDRFSCSQFDILGSSSEMPLSDDLVSASLTDATSDARYPDRFSDYGGSSGCWMGKQSELGRRLSELESTIEIVDLFIEMFRQELSQYSNSRESRLQGIKEKIELVQAWKD